MRRFYSSQRGIALPVMLIMLTVMLVSSIYLMKSTTSTTMTTSNLAYDSSLSKAADLGLHAGFAFLSTAAKDTLVANIPASGYVATLNPADAVNSTAFWSGSTSVTDSANNRIEYVIHRMCMFPGLFNSVSPANNCTLTSAKSKVAATSRLGDSLSSDRAEYQGMPQLHYVITARIFGTRGGNVVNQAVVMMGP
ncbi:MAG: hypothetical protein V4724_33010 [Pseudomonadota bacterium]